MCSSCGRFFRFAPNRAPLPVSAEAKSQGIADEHTCITTGSYPHDVQAGMFDAAATMSDERREDEKVRPSGKYLGGL